MIFTWRDSSSKKCYGMFICWPPGHPSQVKLVKLSFIVIPLHVWTYSGTRCRASQDHSATWVQTYNNEVKQYKPIHNWPTVSFDYTYTMYKSGYLYIN